MNDGAPIPKSMIHGRTWIDDDGLAWFQEPGHPPERLLTVAEIEEKYGHHRQDRSYDA